MPTKKTSPDNVCEPPVPKRVKELKRQLELSELKVEALETMIDMAEKQFQIGIRKVLGATVASVVGLLSKDFLKLVVIALVIVSPLAYFFMEKWLEDFAYRIDIQWTVFALAGAAAVVGATLAVALQTIKAALADPVKSLRSE